jgi:hypothetical protein
MVTSGPQRCNSNSVMSRANKGDQDRLDSCSLDGIQEVRIKFLTRGSGSAAPVIASGGLEPSAVGLACEALAPLLVVSL